MRSRFATPPPMLKWSLQLSKLWDWAWHRLQGDWLNYKGEDLKRQLKEAEYLAEYEDITERL